MALTNVPITYASGNDYTSDLEEGNAATIKYEFDTVPKLQLGQATHYLGFFGATPVVKPTSANQAALTDSTGGSVADATLAAISGSGADTDLNNNFAKIAELVNQLRSELVSLGLITGS